MSTSRTVLPPLAEAAEDAGDVAAETVAVQLSPIPSSSTVPSDAIDQRRRSSTKSIWYRSSISWTSMKSLASPSISIVGTIGIKISGFCHKNSLFKTALKILGLLCASGALALAWLSLKAPTTPNSVEIQTLSAMNRTAMGQSAVHEVLQESLNEQRKQLANERKQLETDRESLINEKERLDLRKWAAQREFIRDCIDYQKNYDRTSSRCSDAIQAWDQPATFRSETPLPKVARRQPTIFTSDFLRSQNALTPSKYPQIDYSQSATGSIALLAPGSTSRALSSSPKEAFLSMDVGLSPIDQDHYPSHTLARSLVVLVVLITTSLSLAYVFNLFRSKAFRHRALTSALLHSAKQESAATSHYDIEPIVIGKTGVSENLPPVGSRNRRGTSSQYRKGDIWTAAYSGRIEAIASFHAEGRDMKIDEVHPHFGTPLQAACQGGQIDAVKLFMRWGADPNMLGGRFKTCLVAAAYSGNIDIVRLLLNRAVLINSYKEITGSALHAACERGSREMVDLLVAHGADTSASGGSYGSPLQAACFRGSPEVVSLLLKSGADAKVRGGRYGTPLHAAAVEGHVEAAELLLSQGAEVNSTTETYGTALQVACQGDHARLARVFLNHGGNPESLDQQSRTPLHHACRIGDTSFTKALLDRGVAVNTADADGCTALHYAALSGHTIITELLIQHGADPSRPDKFGAQPLFRAASLTYVEVVKILLRAGAQVDAKDLYGKTALHGPFHDDNVEITELLLDAGAYINDRADDGKTPLHRAAEVGNVANLRLLLDRGANVNLEDNDQATPLLTAMKGDCKEVSREQLNIIALHLLQLPGVDVNSRSSAAFQEAVAQGQMDVIEAMLAKHVSLNSQGWRYGGVVQAAAISGSLELMRRLLSLGANANMQGGEFGTALQAAAFFGNSTMLDVLLEHGANVNTKGGRFGCVLTAAKKGKAKAVIKAHIMRSLKHWGANESPVATTHEKERWVLTPSGWMWLPAGTYTVSQTIAVDRLGN